jgi:hypothetical protein
LYSQQVKLDSEQKRRMYSEQERQYSEQDILHCKQEDGRLERFYREKGNSLEIL